MKTSPGPNCGCFDVRTYGATGTGRELDTAAIAAAHPAGGGTVRFGTGEYLSYSIHLRSHVTLHLGSGASILAAEPSADGKQGYDEAEPNAWTYYQDFGHSHWHNSLIWGSDLENIAITGPGRIFGRGLSRNTYDPDDTHSYEMFARHVRGLVLDRVEMRYGKDERRPSAYLCDAEEVELDRMNLQRPAGSGTPLIVLHAVSRLVLRHCPVLPDQAIAQAEEVRL